MVENQSDRGKKGNSSKLDISQCWSIFRKKSYNKQTDSHKEICKDLEALDKYKRYISNKSIER